MKTPLRVLVFSLLILLFACSPPSQNLDAGLFTGKPCKVPCWNGLTPGVSTAKDVDQFVQGLSTKEWPARDTLVYDTGCMRVMIADQLGSPVNAFVNMNVDKGKLTYIQSVHESMPSLQQIVDHLGSPEDFRAVHVIGFDGQEYMLTIYYPRQGIVFEVSVDLKDLGFIRPDMVVSSIEYFEPGELLSYFSAQLSCGLGREGAVSTAQIQSAQIQPWAGFGRVQVVQTH